MIDAIRMTGNPLAYRVINNGETIALADYDPPSKTWAIRTEDSWLFSSSPENRAFAGREEVSRLVSFMEDKTK